MNRSNSDEMNLLVHNLDILRWWMTRLWTPLFPSTPEMGGGRNFISSPTEQVRNILHDELEIYRHAENKKHILLLRHENCYIGKFFAQ